MSFTQLEAQLVYAFAPVVPNGTTEDSPYSEDLTFPPAEVVAVSWKVPPGPRGLMGWALGASGAQVIPSNVSEWIVTDDEEDVWALTETVTTGDFTFLGYNTGSHDHVVLIRFLCVPVSSGTTGNVELPFVDPIPNDQIQSADAASIPITDRTSQEAIATSSYAIRP